MPASSRHLDHISRWLWIFLTWHNLPVLKAANLHRPWLLLCKFCFLPSNSKLRTEILLLSQPLKQPPTLSFLLEHLPQPATHDLYTWKHHLFLLLVSLKILNLSVMVFPQLLLLPTTVTWQHHQDSHPYLPPHGYNPHLSGHVSCHSVTPPLPSGWSLDWHLTTSQTGLSTTAMPCSHRSIHCYSCLFTAPFGMGSSLAFWKGHLPHLVAFLLGPFLSL